MICVKSRFLLVTLAQFAAAFTIFYFSHIQYAFADLTVVASVHVAGLPINGDAGALPMPVDLTVTTYFQGDKSRMELSDGSVYIFDDAKDVVYQLDTKQNAYHEESIKKLQNFQSALPKTSGSFTADTDLSTGDSIDTATYMATATTDVPLAGYAHISRVQAYSGGGAPTGHRRNNDGEGSNGGNRSLPLDEDDSASGHGGDSGGRSKFPAYDLHGDLWVSSSYQIPKGKITALPIALQLLWGASPLVGDMSNTLCDLKKLPLHSEITVKQTFTNPANDDATTSPTSVITTTFDVRSVSSSSVSADLFIVPPTYTEEVGPITLPQMAGPVRPMTSANG